MFFAITVSPLNKAEVLETWFCVCNSIAWISRGLLRERKEERLQKVSWMVIVGEDGVGGKMGASVKRREGDMGQVEY